VTRLEVIRPFVEQTVRGFLGVDELKVMDDGTIPIRAGSTAVNVRLVEGTGDGRPLLQVYSPVLHEVTSSPELLGRLNELNATLSFARTFLAGDVVYISMELLAESLDEEQVAHACALVSFAADHWDDELKDRFGGETFFGAEAGEGTTKGATDPSDDAPGGYL